MKRRRQPARHSTVRHMGLLALFVNAWLLAVPALAASDRPLRIVALGDSLTAGFMLAPSESFPAQLERALKDRGHEVEVLNAGVSGDTTSAGLARLDWAIGADTDAVILELGANDALRGIDPAQARANLERILDALAKRGIPVLIAGMRAPGNWGPEYETAFNAIFPELAAAGEHLLYPFFLDGVATEPSLNLDDGLHPNAKGVARIVSGILPMAERLIERAGQRATRLGKG